MFMDITNPIVQSGLLGMCGGLARTIFSLLKSAIARKRMRLSSGLLLLVLNALGGAFLGAVVNLSPSLSLLAGYASYDVLDSGNKLFKIGTIPIKMIASKKKQTAFEEAMEVGK